MLDFDVERRLSVHGHGISHLILLGRLPPDVTASEIRAWFKGLEITDLKILRSGARVQLRPGQETEIEGIVEFRHQDAALNLKLAGSVDVSFRGKRGKVNAYPVTSEVFPRLIPLFLAEPKRPPPLWTRQKSAAIISVAQLDLERWVFALGVMPLTGKEMTLPDTRMGFIASNLDGISFTTSLGKIVLSEKDMSNKLKSNFQYSRRTFSTAKKELDLTMRKTSNGDEANVLICQDEDRELVGNFLRALGSTNIRLLVRSRALGNLAVYIGSGEKAVKKAQMTGAPCFDDCSELAKETFEAFSSSGCSEEQLGVLRKELAKIDVMGTLWSLSRIFHTFLITNSPSCRNEYEKSRKENVRLAADYSYLERHQESAEIARRKALRMYGNVMVKKTIPIISKEETKNIEAPTPISDEKCRRHVVTLFTKESPTPPPQKKIPTKSSVGLLDYQIRLISKKENIRDEFYYLR